MSQNYSGSSYSGSGGGNSDNLYPPNIQDMSLHPPNYDPRRLFPFGLSPIPEVPSELASEVSSIASSPTPSYEDSDTEVESVRSRSIMYSGSCDSIKSNVTIHGKSSSESETDSEDEATEEEDTEDEHSVVVQNIPFDTKPPSFEQKIEASDNTLYNSEVTQVMHQRTFINSTESEQDDGEKDETNEDRNPQGSERPDVVFDMGSGAATASEIFRHLQATRGKQEVTTELAKILTVLKTTLQNDKDSSSSDEETNTNTVPVKNPMPTGKPPRPPFRPKAKSMASLSPIIQAKIKELEQSKTSNPKDEMNLLSKILVHLLCSCKSAAASQELKAVIKQFKEVAKVAMEEGDDTLESIKSNSRPTSRSSRRKIRSRTASGNSNISGNSETDSMNTLTPGDSKSSEDDETGQDSNLNKLRFTSNVGKKDDVESCVSYTLTLPLAKQQEDDGEQYDEGDEEWEWEYEEDCDTSTPTKQGSSGSSRNLTPSEGKSDVSTGSTRKILTEMEMGAYNSSTSHSDHGNSQSTPITEEDEYSDHEHDDVRNTELTEDGNVFCHLEETFKVLSDTYKIITTESNSPECENLEERPHKSDDGFEGILDVISNQCVQIETEIKRTSRQSTPASPGPGKSSLPNSRSGSRASSRPSSKMSRAASRANKAATEPNNEEEDWGDEDEWEYYYPEGDEKNPSRPPSRQKGSSRPSSRAASRQSQSQAVDPRPKSVAKAPSRPASKNENVSKSNTGDDDWNYDEWGDPEEWEYYYEDEADQSGATVCSRPVSRAASRVQSRAPSRQETMTVTLEKSRAPSRQDTFRAPSVQESPRAPSRTEIAPSMMEPIRVASRQDVPKAAEIVAEIKDMGERVPSRLRVVSRPASRAKSRATEAGGEDEEDGWEWDDGSGDWEGYEGQWEYYYEADHEETEAKPEKKQQEAKPPAIVVNKDSRPNSRQSNASRPSSRNSSRPVSRTGSRAASRILGIRSALGSVYEEEDGWYEDDDEIARLSPTLSIAPTTRATSPFPEENGSVHQDNTGSGFSNRRCSVIQESEESTPRPSTVLCKTPTNRDSVTPRMSRPMSKQSNPDTVGYLTRTAGVSVALAAEYLGQDAIKLAANLPQEFIEENILMESKKKKHRRKGSDSQEEHDDDQKVTKKKKKKNKDGKFLPKVGVRELANRLEGELFQDNAVGARMVISRDEVRDVIRETKKKSKNVNSSLQVQDTSKPGTPNRHSPPDKEEKRKSVKEMVQILAGQQVQEQMCGQYPQQAYSGISNCPTSNLPPPPVPPPPQGYYSSPSPSQYPPNYQPYPVEVRPQYPHYPPQDYQGYHPQHPYQQYQQQQQQYHAYQGYPPPPPPHPHYQGYPPQQYQQYPPHQYPPPPPQGYPNQQYPSYPGQQPMIYQTENPNQVKVVSGQGQATIVNMRAKSTGARQKEARDQGNRSPDSEAYGTGSTGSDENQAANIDHEPEGAEQEGGKKPHKRHSRLFKLLQDSDYTDSDTDREYSSRISMKNVEDNHSKESDIDSVCSGLEKKATGLDRKHSFRSHKSSNKESDNESVTSSGVERKLSPNSMQKAVTTRRFMQLSLNQEYEPSSSELSTPNSPTAGGPDRRRSVSKAPSRVWNYHAEDFDSHAGTSDDSSYQSLQSLNSFDSIYDNNAGREVEEIMKRKVQRDGLYRYSTDSPHNYVTASPKTVDLLRNSPKVVANSPKFDNYQRASPKIEQELMDLQNFPSSPGLTLRQLHSHRNFYGAGAGGYGNK